MPKKKTVKPQREVTKRQLSRWKRESRLQRIVMLSGIVVIVAVLAFIGTGIFMNNFAPLREPVLKISSTEADFDFEYNNGEKLPMKYQSAEIEYKLSYYIDALDFYGRANYDFFQNYGFDYPTSLSYIASSVIQSIEKNQFLKEAAAALEPPVTVSEEEITKYIEENGHKDNQATRDAVYATLLEDKLDEYFDGKVPADGEHRAVLAMFLESQQQLEEVKARLNKGESFRDLADQLSLESSSKNKDGDFTWVPKGVLSSVLGNRQNTTLEDLVFAEDVEVNELLQAEDEEQTKSIGYWILKVTEREVVEPTPEATSPTPEETATPASDETATPTPAGTPKAHVWVMLLGSKTQAEQIKAQLDNGADFATLAKANSLHTNAATNGGDLGMLSEEELLYQIGSKAAAVVFPEDDTQELELNTISGPIADTGKSTKGGFWLAQVTGIENKAIDGENRKTLTRNLKSDWVDKIWSENITRAEDLLTQEQISHAVTQAVKRFS